MQKKNGILRILALILCLAMAFSMVSCRSANDSKAKKDLKANSSQKQESKPSDDGSSVDDAEPSDDDLGDLGDEVIDDGDYFEDDLDDGFGSEIIDFTRPITDRQTSTGTKMSYDDGLGDLFGNDGDDMSDLPGDIADGNTGVKYEPFVQKYGEPVKNSTKREINVSNTTDGILFKDFNGIGCNVFPTQFTLYAQQSGARDIPAYAEISTKRFNDIGACYARSWFQLDWIMTDTVNGDAYKLYSDDIYSDPDRKNYLNGVYDFDSDAFNSAMEYYEMLEEAGTEVYLAFGWKHAYRIQHWFGNDPMNSQIAAPKDLDAYANAAVAVFKHARNVRGLTNFNTLAFYNEPDRINNYEYQGSWDYTSIGDKAQYFAEMVRRCRKALSADPETKDVRIGAADSSNYLNMKTEDYVNVYLYNHAKTSVDMFTFHSYPAKYRSQDPNKDAYSALIDDYLDAYHFYEGAELWITEYYSCGQDVTDELYNYDYLAKPENGGNPWSHTAASFVIATAHTGIHGLLKWSFVGGMLLDPLYFDPANGSSSSWIRPNSGKTVSTVFKSYYEETMMNNYIGKHANVHYLEWQGDDLRCASFTSKDGSEFTLLVEAEENGKNRDLIVNLEKSLGGRTVYIYRFDFAHSGAELGEDKNVQASIPECILTIDNVADSFTSPAGLVSGEYGVYVFTTRKPMTQIELYRVDDPTKQAVNNTASVSANEKVKIKPVFVDNAGASEPAVSDATVEWEIKRYSNEAKEDPKTKVEEKIVCREKIAGADLGKIKTLADGSCEYTLPADAQKGDVIAIRCSYKTDPDRFASAMIEVVD